MKTHRLTRTAEARLPAFQLTQLAAACGLLLAGAASHAQQAAPAAAPAEAASAPAAAPSAPAAIAPVASASPAATQEVQRVQTIVVTGIRKSLESSLGLKRDSRGVVDGIVAEDIGKFPDTNLAESMQRISGVSIDRSATGEGSRVTVRGVGPDFNLVLLNGRQMPASSIEGTTASSSRAFDFANLASEAVSALEVYKTSRASTPTGGIGATVNIKTARPLDNARLVSSLGVKAVTDASNSRLRDAMKGSSVTPELSGIYSNTFADGTFGVALTGSWQKRSSGYNQAEVPGGWRTFRGDEGGWGTIPQPGTPGAENITNRPRATDIYSVPQNINYSVNGVQRERTNGQLTLQYAPTKAITATLDYTYSENKIRQQRNELSAWFNFGPSVSSWTNGPVAAPTFYSETIDPATSDIAMAGAKFATKNQNKSIGLNLAWKLSDAMRLELDAHSSNATSGADSPYGSNASLGTASFNRGNTSVDFTKDFPVLGIEGSTLDPALMQVTGSSFRNSYMKSGVDQLQLRGNFKLNEASKLDFGVTATNVSNRSAFSNMQRDTWGGATNAGDYPDSVWRPDTLRQYFGRIDGSNNPALFNNFFTWDFETVRGLAAAAAGNDALYRRSDVFTTDRRVKEKSQSAFVQYSTEWDFLVPWSGAVGVRYEKTDVASTALVPTPTGITWTANNEFSLISGAPNFTKLTGSYQYFLPSLDLDADLTDNSKLRMSYGETIGRPNWGAIQGGQTLNQLVRIDGGTGEQGNPALKPLKSKNFDLSLEYYYAKASYVALGLFQKNIANYLGDSQFVGTPFNVRTPANGVLFNEAVATGGCPGGDLTCIRNYILRNYDGRNGVVRGADDANGNATGTIAAQPDDPVATFLITTPANQKSNRLRGLELNVQHMFGSSGFGVSANYTKVTSGLKYDNASRNDQFALPGVSNSANLVLFYENDQFNVRAAYNWRDDFLSNLRDGGGRPNPVYTEAYAQLDLSIGYKLTDQLTFQFEAINLNDGVQRLHSRTKEQLIGVTQTGRRYMLGARYQF
jgi:TonB-dependent receptor